MIIPNHYCANLQAGLMISLNRTGGVDVTTCPITPVNITVNDNQVFDHPTLVKIREENQQTGKIPHGCNSCYEKACNGRRGHTRSSSNGLYIKDQLLYNQTGPKMITFKLDFICNLACITCGPSVSTKWRSITPYNNAGAQMGEERIREILRNMDLSNLETVHIFGGEPLMTRTHEIILEELSAYGKNITIWYDTNITTMPSARAMELWDKFHLIRLKFSIDGLGKAYEYLRWPASWDYAQEIMLRMRDELPPNHMFTIRPAMGFLNFHLIDDIRKWYKEFLPTNRMGDPTEFEYNAVYGIYSPGYMPEDMINSLYDIYPRNDPIFRILPSDRYLTSDGMAIIKQTLEKLDQQRGLDYRTALPHIVPYLK